MNRYNKDNSNNELKGNKSTDIELITTVILNANTHQPDEQSKYT